MMIQCNRPVVVYGGMVVDSLVTLSVGPGMHFYFHENAGLDVYGSLRILGRER